MPCSPISVKRSTVVPSGSLPNGVRVTAAVLVAGGIANAPAPAAGASRWPRVCG